MSSSRRVLTAAEVARHILEYAGELDNVDSDIELEMTWYKFRFTAMYPRNHDNDVTLTWTGSEAIRGCKQ